MKHLVIKHYPVLMLAAVGLVCVTLVAWNQHPDYQVLENTEVADTVPLPKRQNAITRDLDKEIEKLDLAIQKLGEVRLENLEEISEKINEQLINQQLHEEAIEQALEQAEIAIKEIDFDKIQTDIQSAVRNMELQLKMDRDNITFPRTEVEVGEINRVMEEVKVDLKHELEEVKRLDLDKVKYEISELNNGDFMADVRAGIESAAKELRAEDGRLKTELDKARKELAVARKELGKYQEMIYLMEKDQLLDTRKNYKIIYSDGALFINDKKQGDEILAKYKKFLNMDLTIIKKHGNISINKKEPVHFD